MASSQLTPLTEKHAHALRLIDEAHADDPRRVSPPDGSEDVPYELDYARKMTRWLALRCPGASPALQLACRAQHFRRWETPRDSYPSTRAGYLTWRARQKSQAAARVKQLLAEVDESSRLPAEERDRVAALVSKQDLATDEEAQALEDVACLVFLDDQLDDFDKKPAHDEDKVVGILRKTWGKMSPRGREMALGMEHSDRARALLAKALGDSGQ